MSGGKIFEGSSYLRDHHRVTFSHILKSDMMKRICFGSVFLWHGEGVRQMLNLMHNKLKMDPPMMASSAAAASLAGVRPVDSLTVLSIVDNETDSLSSACACCAEPLSGIRYCSEIFQSLPRTFQIDMAASCCAAHGLSLLLVTGTTNDDGTEETHSCLFDAGPHPSTFADNARKLGVDLSSVERIVLSHYHADHSAGLRSAVPLVAEARKAAGLSPPVVDLHPANPEMRGIQLPNGKIAPSVPRDPTFDEIRSMGGDVVASSSAHAICGGSLFVSGEIPRVTDYEVGLPGHMTKLPGSDWEADPLILDERYVTVHVKNRGLVVFSACSHAGIVNVCKDAVARGGGLPLFGVMGGFHLAGGPGVEGRVGPTVTDLRELNPSVIFPGHCTGWKAKMALAQAFPDRVQPAVVGGKYVFERAGDATCAQAAAAADKAPKGDAAHQTFGQALGEVE